MTSARRTILTIGHSSLTYERLLELLRSANVTAVADVRSTPYSRQSPQFNRKTLRDELRADGISYVFLGEELGGRPAEQKYFCDGIADYEKMREAPKFEEGIRRVEEGSERYRIALMCSEKDPLDCHRCLLVGRALRDRGLRVEHIISNGARKSQEEIEQQLLTMANSDRADFFNPPEQQIGTAYRKRSRKVAYTDQHAREASGD